MRRAVNILALVLLIALVVGLYRAKTEAGADRARLEAMRLELAEEHQTIRILRNEVGELENPERLRALAEERLGLAPIDPQRVVTLEDAARLIEPGVADTTDHGGEW